MRRKQKNDHEKKVEEFFDQLNKNSGETPFASEEERLQAKGRLFGAILERADQPKSRSKLIIWSYAISGVAAALVLGWVGMQLWETARTEKVPLITTVSTGEHEQKRVTLPDSSVITLNAGTTISYTNQFNKEGRIVSLQKGEAFFDIKQNPQSPFSVLTEGVVTKVLGTSFNIIKYQHTRSVKIAVKTGRVSIGNSTKEFCQLTPAEQVMVNFKDDQFTKTTGQGAGGDEWMTGRIVIREEPMANLLERLETVYDVEFDKYELADASLRTLSFNANTRLEDVLKIVEKISNARFTIVRKPNAKTRIYVK